MSLKKHINNIDMTKNPSDIFISVLNILKVNPNEDFAEIACHQEILLGQTVFDHVRRCVREIPVIEYFTRKRYFTSRVIFGVRTIHEVLVDGFHPTFKQWLPDGPIVCTCKKWLPDGNPVLCTSDNIKEVFKAKVEELNKNAMRDLSRLTRE